MKRRERERKVEEAKTRNEQETKVDGGTEACAGSACALRASNNLFRSQFVLRECRVASYESKYNAGTWCNLFTVRAFSSVCVCYYVHLCASRVCRCVCVCVCVQCAPLWNARLACATGTARYSATSAVVTPGTSSVARRIGYRGLSGKEFQVECGELSVSWTIFVKDTRKISSRYILSHVQNLILVLKTCVLKKSNLYN